MHRNDICNCSGERREQYIRAMEVRMEAMPDGNRSKQDLGKLAKIESIYPLLVYYFSVGLLYLDLQL